MHEVFAHPVAIRYAEVDQQGVVFNAHYLTYFDDAMTAFLADGGLPYPALMAAGFDVMLVRSEIDWRGAVRWTDEIAVRVSLARVGTTSFALDFAVVRDGTVLVEGRTTYVCVDVAEHESRPIPDLLRDALGPKRPLRAL